MSFIDRGYCLENLLIKISPPNGKKTSGQPKVFKSQAM
jgi:hypothetical protein